MLLALDIVSEPHDRVADDARPFVVVDDPARMRELVARLADAPVAALDTESNGFHAYRERVCLLQISVGDEDAIVDPLAVDPQALGPWLADPACVKILHAADNDIRSLRRDWDLQLHNVFDTMLAARALAWPKKGLGDILAAHFGCRTDKRWQRHDWSQRPLPRGALDYARTDTRYLAALRELQIVALAEAGRLEEFDHACLRMTELVARPRVIDPDAWAHVDGARGLDEPGRSVLAALVALREELAETLDRAPYRVLADAVLVELARTRPTARHELTRTRGVGGPIANRYASTVLQRIADAVDQPPPPWPPAPPRPDARLRARFDALRDWRRDQATRRGLEPDIVLSKDALQRIAELEATDVDADALVACGALDAWERERYAEAILGALARVRR